MKLKEKSAILYRISYNNYILNFRRFKMGIKTRKVVIIGPNRKRTK